MSASFASIRRVALLLGAIVTASVVIIGSSAASGTGEDTKLTLLKSPAEAQAPTGSLVQYALTLDTGEPTKGVTVSDTVPPGMTFVGVLPSPGTSPGFTCQPTAAGFECTGPPETSDVATIEYWVKVTAKPGSVLHNTATADAPNALSQATADATLRVTGGDTARLEVAKTVLTPSNGEAAPGSTVRYRVVVTNHGPGVATGLALVDDNSADVASNHYVSLGLSCSFYGSRIDCRFAPKFGFGNSRRFEYSVTVPKDASCDSRFPDTARIVATGGDPKTGIGFLNADSVLSASASVKVVCPPPDDEVSLVPAPFNSPSNPTKSLEVDFRNDSSTTISTVSFDPVGWHVESVGAPIASTCHVSNGDMLCSGLSVASGASYSLTIESYTPPECDEVMTYISSADLRPRSCSPVGLSANVSFNGAQPIKVTYSGKATPVPTTTQAPSSAATSSSYKCTGAGQYLFDNWNGQAVSNGGAAPTFSTDGKAYCFISIETYHWNNASGAAPGTIALERISGPGAALPPTAATGEAGQDNVANAAWMYSDQSWSTKPLILDGTYRCVDSNPGTWSQTGGEGFCRVYGAGASKS